RIATSDAEPDLQAGVLRETGTARIRFAAYRRLAAVDPTARSLSIGNSLGALLLGRDDGDYFPATGAELTIAPAVTLPQGVGGRRGSGAEQLVSRRPRHRARLRRQRGEWGRVLARAVRARQSLARGARGAVCRRRARGPARAPFACPAADGDRHRRKLHRRARALRSNARHAVAGRLAVGFVYRRRALTWKHREWGVGSGTFW